MEATNKRQKTPHSTASHEKPKHKQGFANDQLRRLPRFELTIGRSGAGSLSSFSSRRKRRSHEAGGFTRSDRRIVKDMLNKMTSPASLWGLFATALTFQPTQDIVGLRLPPAVTGPAPQPLSLLERVDRWFWQQECRQRDRYLAQATDTVDLEQRIRRLERSGFNQFV
jgi:hypothetical protein